MSFLAIKLTCENILILDLQTLVREDYLDYFIQLQKGNKRSFSQRTLPIQPVLCSALRDSLTERSS